MSCIFSVPLGIPWTSQQLDHICQASLLLPHLLPMASWCLGGRIQWELLFLLRNLSLAGKMQNVEGELKAGLALHGWPGLGWLFGWRKLEDEEGREQCFLTSTWSSDVPTSVVTTVFSPLTPCLFCCHPNSYRSQLSFFSLWWIRPGCLGNGPHDGAWDGWPPPWCWLSSWWAARSGARPGPHGWAASRWQQSAGLVWYWPVNHPLGKKLKKPVWVKYFYSAYRTSERLGW